MKKNIAEFIGTFWLVLGGCGSAVFAAGIPDLGIGFVGVSLAFGLSVLTGIYALGHISGAHFNPAVTFGLWAGGRFNGKEILPYVVYQIAGAILGATVIYFIASGLPSFSIDNTKAGAFATNGYGAFSPMGYSMIAAIITEFVLTFIFLVVILGSTHSKAPKGLAGISIGLALTLIHLVSIPITNTSVNPARSISQALFTGGASLTQLWLFILVPILGAICAGFTYKYISPEKED